MKKQFFSPTFLLALGLMIGLAACSGTASTGNGQDTATPGPTDTLFPTYSFVQPTEAPQITTAVAATAAAGGSGSNSGLDAEKVALGQGRYTALECNTCHGEAGEGVTDKGPALTAFAMSEDDFISFMRSGGKLGNEHQYSTNRLSESGGKNLYEYLRSISTS